MNVELAMFFEGQFQGSGRQALDRFAPAGNDRRNCAGYAWETMVDSETMLLDLAKLWFQPTAFGGG